MSKQPVWKFIANLGDAHPIKYGGLFVYVDETGVYPPEAELLVEPSDEEWHDDDRKEFEADGKPHESTLRWKVYRFILEPCTYINGILSDNKFHPNHPAWFAKYLHLIASSSGQPDDRAFISMFLSDDPCERAWAWRAVGEYHGWENLDSYPLTLTREEVNERYKDLIAVKFKPKETK